MNSSSVSARYLSPARKALAEHLAIIADLKARLGAISVKTPKSGERRGTGGGGQHVEADRIDERARLQQMLAAAIRRRGEIVADIMATEELPLRVRAYQDLVQQVNAAWNDILAYDDTMRRRFPGHTSIFNTAGPHERVVIGPSTDHSPVPAVEIDPRKLFEIASAATDRLVEMLESDAEAGRGRS
ncbi:MAG: hypothetical protein ABSC92_12435 [Rhizomicrobium sp.]|jgi:hypothetical protein